MRTPSVQHPQSRPDVSSTSSEVPVTLSPHQKIISRRQRSTLSIADCWTPRQVCATAIPAEEHAVRSCRFPMISIRAIESKSIKEILSLAVNRASQMMVARTIESKGIKESVAELSDQTLCDSLDEDEQSLTWGLKPRKVRLLI